MAVVADSEGSPQLTRAVAFRTVPFSPPPATLGPVTQEPAYVDFQGGRAVTAPLTWGQRAMWQSVAEFTAPHTFVNLCRTVAVSPRAQADVPRVARAIGALVGRHESLRTQVRFVDGQLRQVVSAAGRLPLLVSTAADTDPDGRVAARALADRLGDSPFDHATEWPLRVALVVVNDRVRQIVLVFSHSTTDFAAVELLLRDLRLILVRGAFAGEPGLQSVDVAHREQQIEQRRSQRAVAYWVQQFPRLPAAGMFTPAAAALTPRYRKGRLVSTAIRTALGLIAARHRVSTSTVLLAAVAAVVTAGSGQDICGLVIMGNNRFQPEYGDAISKLNQFGLCRLDLSDRPGFAELLPRVRQASLDGYRRAYYDPAAMEEAFAEMGHDFHTALAPLCYVNDIRLPDDLGQPAAGLDETTVRAAVARTTFTWSELLDRFAWRCRIQIVDAPRAVEMVITADTRYLPPQRAEELLRDIESLVVEAAFHEVPWPWLRECSLPGGSCGPRR